MFIKLDTWLQRRVTSRSARFWASSSDPCTLAFLLVSISTQGHRPEIHFKGETCVCTLNMKNPLNIDKWSLREKDDDVYVKYSIRAFILWLL